MTSQVSERIIKNPIKEIILVGSKIEDNEPKPGDTPGKNPGDKPGDKPGKNPGDNSGDTPEINQNQVQIQDQEIN